MKIILSQIGKTYNKKQIFRNIDSHFDSYKTYGISGHNGSGKSTLLKIIAGYITPTSGSIQYFDGDKEIKVEEIFAEISYAAPYLDLPYDLSFGQLMDFHFSIKTRRQNISNEAVNSHFNLPLDIPIRQFSSGMIQRVKLALAFFTQSKILILDEPTETLDSLGFDCYEKLLREYSASRTTIIASNKPKDFIQCEKVLNVTDFLS